MTAAADKLNLRGSTDRTMAETTAAHTTLPTPMPDASAALPWRRLLLWFLGTRVFIWAVAGLSLQVVPPGRFFTPPRHALDWLMHWDAQWYLEVAREGYLYDPTRMSNVNFLPMYPTIVRLVNAFVDYNDLSAYIVSHAFCLLATLLLWKLAYAVTQKARAADWSVLFFLLGPVGVFYASMYSEATFITFAIGTLLAARRQRWFLAGVLGLGAALSRSVGLLLIVPLVIEYVWAHREWAQWQRLKTWLGLVCCGGPGFGLLLYFGLLWYQFDDPRAYFISQQWGGHFAAAPWKMFQQGTFVNLPLFYKIWFASSVFGGLALTVLAGVMRLPWSFTALAVASCTLYYSIESLEGMPRFLSVVVPFYLALGLLAARFPVAGRTILGLSTALSVLSIALFANGYWFT